MRRMWLAVLSLEQGAYLVAELTCGLYLCSLVQPDLLRAVLATNVFQRVKYGSALVQTEDMAGIYMLNAFQVVYDRAWNLLLMVPVTRLKQGP